MRQTDLFQWEYKNCFIQKWSNSPYNKYDVYTKDENYIGTYLTFDLAKKACK